MGEIDYYALREVKRHDPLGLLRQPMMQVGASTQTLAAVRRLANKSGETFASVRVIADLACLQRRTVQRHLDELVAYDWLQYRSRQKRRTPTYIVPKSLLNSNDAMKFGILPRWAAASLPTWAERAVFALVVSRDALNEKLADETEIEEVDIHGRLQYSLRHLAQDSGLSTSSVERAKAKLVNRGVLTIDPLVYYRDDLGRIHSTADTLMLNPDFEVCSSLVDRSPKMSHCPKRDRVSDSLHRDPILSHTPPQNVACPSPNLSLDPPPKCRLQLSQSLNHSSEAKKKTTAESQATSAGVCFSPEELAQAEAAKAAEEEERLNEDERKKFIQRCRENFGNYCPNEIEAAVDMALTGGCTVDQLRARARWMFEKRIRYKPEHRAGALYYGISRCTPELKEDQGWPSFTQ